MNKIEFDIVNKSHAEYVRASAKKAYRGNMQRLANRNMNIQTQNAGKW